MPDAISLTATRSGRLADAVAQMRDIPARVIPYAANAALNTIGSRARKDIQAEMPRVFDRPNPYTLNSLRIEQSTRETLTIRIAVKDSAPTGGTKPEHYLMPAVFGAGRNEKRFEASLRYAGVLPAGWRVVPAAGAKLDSYGNVSRAETKRILDAVESKSSAGSAYFAVSPEGTTRPRTRLAPGVYARAGRGRRGVRPVLIFVRKAPQYRARLPFAAIVERRADADFRTEFARVANSILSR